MVLENFGLAAACLVPAGLALWLHPAGPAVVALWPSVGLVFAALLRGGTRLFVGGAVGLSLAWLGVAAAGGLSLPAAALAGALVGPALAGGATLCATRLAPADGPLLGSIRGVLRLAAVGAVLHPLLATSMVAAALLAQGDRSFVGADGTLPLLVFCVGTGSMALLVAPAVAGLDRPLRSIARSPLEAMACKTGLVAATWILIRGAGALETAYPPLYVVLPLLVWAALRFGANGAALGDLTVALVALAALTIPGVDRSVTPALQLRLELYLSCLAISMLALGAAVEERRRAREALDEERRRLDATVAARTAELASERDLSERAIETSGALVAVVKEDGTVRRVNAAFARAAARPAASVTGLPFAALVDVDHARLRATPGPEGPPARTAVDALLRTPVGRAREVRWQARSIDDTGDLLLAGLDLEERNQARRELERAVQLLTATLEATADAILAVDLDGRVIARNRPFVELWQVPDELLRAGDGVALDRFLASRTRDPAAHAALSARLAAFPELESEDVETLRDSRVIERFSLPQRADGRIVGRVWSYRDVTAARRAEAERDRSLAAEQTARAGAERAYEEARDAVRLREEFMAAASHELRTPLTSIKAQLQGLRRALAKGEPATDLRAVALRVRRQWARLDAVVDELLDVSELSAGETSPRPVPCDLRELAADAIRAQGDAAVLARSPIRLREGPPVIGPWDPERLGKLVRVLLANALKFGAGRPIEVAVEERGDLAALTVTDHGIGIAAGDQRRIFERFERAVDTRHYGGFGLGLWIARRIVEAHGGAIRVDSQPGQGASFTVTLPRAQLPAAVEPAPAPWVS